MSRFYCVCEVYLIVVGTAIVLQIGIFVMDKVNFTPHENQSLVSFFAVLIQATGKKFEVLRTCRGSVTMATIYAVLFGETEYSQCEQDICMCYMQSNVNIWCHLETFQVWSTNFGESPRKHGGHLGYVTRII